METIAHCKQKNVLVLFQDGHLLIPWPSLKSLNPSEPQIFIQKMKMSSACVSLRKKWCYHLWKHLVIFCYSQVGLRYVAVTNNPQSLTGFALHRSVSFIFSSHSRWQWSSISNKPRSQVERAPRWQLLSQSPWQRESDTANHAQACNHPPHSRRYHFWKTFFTNSSQIVTSKPQKRWRNINVPKV